MILLPSRICFRFSPTYASFISISSAIVYHCNRLLSIKHSSLDRTALLTREAQSTVLYWKCVSDQGSRLPASNLTTLTGGTHCLKIAEKCTDRLDKFSGRDGNW